MPMLVVVAQTNGENIETVKKIILDNHRITIREVVDDVAISFGFYGCFRLET